jgi:putative aldouronate transport system substrate-binding protein
MTNNALQTYYVVNKNFSNPEALVKLANYTFEFWYGKSGILDARPYLLTSPTGNFENWAHGLVHTFIPNKNHLYHLQHKEVMKTGDTSVLNSESLLMWNRMQAWYNGDRSEGLYWVNAALFGTHATSAESAIEEYTKNGQILMNAFDGVPTETMRTRQSSLDDLRDEIFTRIIIGELPISAFDTFVADWKRQGGDDITREVNAWYKENR